LSSRPSSRTRSHSSGVGRTVFGPSSSRNPSSASVRTVPPGREDASRTRTLSPRRASAKPATSPERPPPTTTVRGGGTSRRPAVALPLDDLDERAQERRVVVEPWSAAELGDAGAARLVSEELVDLVERLDVVGDEGDRDRQHLLLAAAAERPNLLDRRRP